MRIGIDLGGTKTECILIDETGKELARNRIKTEKNYDGTISGIISIVNRFENDFGNSPAMAKRLSELIPEAYVEFLPGLIHMGLAENPQEFNSRLVPFLQDNL